VRTVRESYRDTPVMPVIDGEAAYEMLMDNLPTEWTRRMFWLCMTSGAAGHTYGANGIWQVNRKDQPHGPSPHHAAGSAGYGRIAWDEAMKLPGSSQVANAKKLFEQYPWQTFEPHPEWVAFADTTSPVAFEGAKWIWFPQGEPAKDAPVAKRYLRKEFEIGAGGKPAAARLAATADDRVTVSLNGRELGTAADWRRPVTFDVAALLREGRNEIVAVVENVKSDVTANPAGFICSMEGLKLVSDGTWQASKDESGERVAAAVLGAYGMQPWGTFTPPAQGETPLTIGAKEGVRIVYVPRADVVVVRGLSPKHEYAASYFDPVSGESTTAGRMSSDADGTLQCTPPANVKEDDWVIVLE
jgi:hypothetical protein